MMNSEEIKLKLLTHCKSYVQERLQRVQNAIASIQQSLTSETKSSAGDKHETGRAMLQLEREKAGKQLAEVQNLQEVLAKISLHSSSDRAHLGSLVITSHINYFISISVGEIKINDQSYFAIAANSPIGKLLLGKTTGEQVDFNTKSIKITNIT